MGWGGSGRRSNTLGGSCVSGVPWRGLVGVTQPSMSQSKTYLAHQHVVHDRAEAPPVHGEAVALVRERLRRHVLDGAAKRAGLAIRLVDRNLAQAKVGKEDVACIFAAATFGASAACPVLAPPPRALDTSFCPVFPWAHSPAMPVSAYRHGREECSPA